MTETLDRIAPLDTDRLTLGELRTILEPEIVALADGFEYFTPSLTLEPNETRASRVAQPIGRYRWIACYAVTGGSEGHYIHVDRLYLKGPYDRDFTREPLFLAKTFGGYAQACAIAAHLGARLGA
jgi:hypothetical protein